MKVRQMAIRLLIFSMICFIAFQACIDDKTCSENVVSGVVFGLSSSDIAKTRTTMIFPLLFPDDTVYPYQTDTLHLLPLSLSNDTTSYLFTIEGNADTMTFFHHQKEPEFLGLYCGFSPRFTLDSIHQTSHFIKSVSIINATISNDVFQRNILIYY